MYQRHYFSYGGLILLGEKQCVIPYTTFGYLAITQFDFNPLLPKSDLEISLCPTTDDSTRQKETP